jgi:hypothetical protein
VLSECCFLLPRGFLRQRMRFLFQCLGVAVLDMPATWWDDTFDWMERFREHEPDLADAQLAILCSKKPEFRLWTYDEGFRTTWRRADGSRIPLATRTGTARAGSEVAPRS